MVSLAAAQSVLITDSPRHFSAKSPVNWLRQPSTTGNTKLNFRSPMKTPYAECNVVVQTQSALRGHTQAEFNALLSSPPDLEYFARSMSPAFANFSVISGQNGALSSLPAQRYKVQFSVGTPEGKQWGIGTFTTTISVPDIIWIVGCTGLGNTIAEAQKAFDYWQLEFGRFPTYVKFL